MKISSAEDSTTCCYPGSVVIMPRDSYCCRTTKDLIGGVGEVSKGLLGLTKKELRKLKRKEKENLWKRNNRRNAQPEPVVVHLPKEPPPSPIRSALQTVHKESAKAREHHCYGGGLNHEWVGFYDKGITSDQSCINEWNAMDSLESKRPPSPDSLTNKEETELLIRSKLKEIMMSVDIDEVTSKYIRQRLEEDMKMDLFKFKSFIDQEMLTILGQMDAATEIFPHVYLGSEWNASNLEELKSNGVGFILNVTKEIDNFYPGMFDYLNIRVYDDEKTELLRHWDDTYKYISQVKEKGSKVLVHCKMGISRSASVVIAYAMKAHNLSLDAATELVRMKRGCIKPNQAFTSQLKIYQGILDASRQRHNALFRSKSETNLKSSAAFAGAHAPNGSIGNHLATTRFNYVPRGMQVMPIPDFKPRSNSSSAVALNSSCHSGDGGSPKETKPVVSNASHELATLHIPSPIPGRRSCSWSPDEEATKMLNLQPFEDSEFGESLQKSRSLNDQAWQAHVTVIQRDLRDPGGGEMFAVTREEGFAEALNPLWIPQTTPSSPSSIHRLEDVQLSSSVKERINEFENVTSSTTGAAAPCAKVGGADAPTVPSRSPVVNSQTTRKGGSHPSLAVTLDDVTTTESSTDHIDATRGEGGEEFEAALTPMPTTLPTSAVTTSSPSSGIVPVIVSTQPELENGGPLVTQTKGFAQRHQVVIVPLSQVSLEEDEVATFEVSPLGATNVLRNEPIIWPTGLVRKQKEDFEGKVKLRLEDKPRIAIGKGDTHPTLVPQDSSNSALFPQMFSPHLGPVEFLKGVSSPLCLKEDPFSMKVDRVFDREERKDRSSGQPPLTGVGGCTEVKRESPSRNNSWGSFDSAVVLPDRETPSRQSSWGSCDTRLSGGSLLSRNSSLGAFDSKLPTIISTTSSATSSSTSTIICVPPDGGLGGTNPPLHHHQQISYVAYCIDKESALPHDRRCKAIVGGLRGPSPNNGTSSYIPTEECCHGDDVGVSRSVANVKAYAPMPFKTQGKDSPQTRVERPSDESPSTLVGRGDMEGEVFFIGSPPAGSQYLPFSEILSFSGFPSQRGGGGGGVKRCLKTSPQTPEHEIPLPGTVKQQMQKLESRTRHLNGRDAVMERLSLLLAVPPPLPASIGRSLSSGCVCASSSSSPGTSGAEYQLKKITRSCSEKRAKTEPEGAQKGNVRKITKALEGVQRQGIDYYFPDGKEEGALPSAELRAMSSSCNSSSSYSSSLRRKQKGKRERMDLAMSRSQSLERLGGRGGCTSSSSSVSPPTPNKRLSAHHPQIVSSQNFLDQLVSETQAQVHQLEKAQEEINVKNLVDMFEDSKPEKRHQWLPLHGEWPLLESDSSRDICLKRKVRPRSESMGEKELPPVPQRKSSLDYTFRPVHITPGGLLSPSGKGAPHHLTNGGTQNSLSPPKLSQLPQPPQGCNRACSSEVRRKKQEGKTHPLSKLAPRENTL